MRKNMLIAAIAFVIGAFMGPVIAADFPTTSPVTPTYKPVEFSQTWDEGATVRIAITGLTTHAGDVPAGWKARFYGEYRMEKK